MSAPGPGNPHGGQKTCCVGCRVGDSNLSLEAPSPPATPFHGRRPPLAPQPDDTSLRTMVTLCVALDTSMRPTRSIQGSWLVQHVTWSCTLLLFLLHGHTVSSSCDISFDTETIVFFHVQSAQSADSRSDKSGHEVVQSFTAGLRRRSDTHYGPQVPQHFEFALTLGILHHRD